jgi:hypothetical protein
MALGRDDLDVLHSDAAEFVGYEVSGFLYVGLVLLEGTDAGDTEEIFEFAQEALLIIAGKIYCGRSHGLILSLVVAEKCFVHDDC